MSDINSLNCPKCNHTMSPCYSGAGFLRVWWCQACDHTDKAIGRERLLRPAPNASGRTTEAVIQDCAISSVIDVGENAHYNAPLATLESAREEIGSVN